MLTRTHVNETEMTMLAKELLAALPGPVLALSGELGSGKTTLARAMLRSLGYEGRVMSPTFIIACEYLVEERLIQHLDFYRVDDFSVLLDLGLEEMLDTADLIIIEWADLFLAELRQCGARGYHLHLEPDESGGRQIHVETL